MSLCVCCDGGLEAPSVGQDAGEVIWLFCEALPRSRGDLNIRPTGSCTLESRRITANRWSAVAVGDTSARIYLGSVNINLIGVGHRLVPFHYRILESRFSAMLFCERGYPRNGNPSLTMQCLLLFINRNLSQMSTQHTTWHTTPLAPHSSQVKYLLAVPTFKLNS